MTGRGGESKVNPPNSPPSNPIHKAATAAQTGPKPVAQTKNLTPLPQTKVSTPTGQTKELTPTASFDSNSYNVNRKAVGVAVAGLIFLSFH